MEEPVELGRGHNLYEGIEEEVEQMEAEMKQEREAMEALEENATNSKQNEE